jgi:transaldolase
MALYLDSADVGEARLAAELGFVAGATTNPAIMAKAGRPAEEVITDLCAILPGTIFHQVISAPGPTLEAEIERFRAISARVAFKIPCSFEYLRVVYDLAQQGVIAAVTAVYSAAQAYIAAQAGARCVIPYVNRATRLCGDGPALVAEIAGVLDGSQCEILAASIKSPVEAVDTLLAGAEHLTLPWDVLTAMAEHPLTDRAMEEFARSLEGG